MIILIQITDESSMDESNHSTAEGDQVFPDASNCVKPLAVCVKSLIG